MRRIAVVGGGLAGARTCTELRARGYDGELTLVGAEQHPPYDRPPLSKAVLSGLADGLADVLVELDVAALDVTAAFGTRAVGLRPGVLDTTGGEIAFDGLALAFGAAPIRLPTDRGASVLRTVDDAVALRAAMVDGARVVVVGAGWIGAEVTTAALAHGCAVTVLEAGPQPLTGPLGEAVGALFAPWYAAAGAELRTGAAVAEAGPDGVRLGDGEWLPADLVLTGLGVRPDVGWLAGSGVDVGVGVHTDASLRTSLPGVVAVGDCVERFSPRAGRRLRLEHWDDALHAPEVAASSLLGGEDVYDPVPYVWSEQFGRLVQWSGLRAGDPQVWRGDPAGDGGWSAAWLADGRLVGFLAVNRPKDAVQARKVIATGRPVDAAKLADAAVAVRAALTTTG